MVLSRKIHRLLLANMCKSYVSVTSLLIGNMAVETTNADAFLMLVVVVGHSIYVCSLPMTATVAQLAVEHNNFGPLKSNGVQVRSNKQQGFRFGFDEFESLDSIHIAIKWKHRRAHDVR